MRVLQVHNRYRVRGGEDIAVDAVAASLREAGIGVSELVASSGDMPRGFFRKTATFALGIYSLSARARLRRLIRRDRPDVVHVHNVYPLLSPSVLAECRRAGLPVVMTCHNLRLLCPSGTTFSGGEPCRRCWKGREYWCVLRDCRQDLVESAAYALRTWVARRLDLFKANVTLFITPTEFVKRELRDNGFQECEFAVVPHMISPGAAVSGRGPGAYVAYAGRVSPEKGVQVLVSAAARCPTLPIRIAGDYSAMPGLPRSAPGNVRFVGVLRGQALKEFYACARLVVAPSLCYEAFGLAAAEAMGFGLPVVGSRIGGLPEVIVHGRTGLLFEPGDAADLARKLKALWHDRATCESMGRAARDWVLTQYSPRAFLGRLLAAYERAVEINRRGPR